MQPFIQKIQTMKKQIIIGVIVLSALAGYTQTYQIDWQNCYGGSQEEIATDIIRDGSGYLILGTSESADGDVGYNLGNTDAWLIKTDSTGSMIWSKVYGGSDNDYLSRIIPAPQSGYYLVGSSYSSDWDLQGDPYPNSEDYWIMKIDNAGNKIWSRLYGGTGGDRAQTALIDADSNLVVLGTTGSEDGDVSLNFGASDIWMIKIDSEGELQWDHSSGTDWVDMGKTMIPTPDGGYLLGCDSELGYLGFITCMPRYDLMNNLLIKLDADRNMQWHRCYGGNGWDVMEELLALEDGYMILSNTESDDGDLEGVEVHGGQDIWLMRTNLNGEVLWQKCYGGSNAEFAKRIFHNSDGTFTLFGYTWSNDGQVSQNHSNFLDIWMLTISDEGELINQRCIGGIGFEHLLHGVIQKSDLNFVIAGVTDLGPSYDVTCTPHNLYYYERDIWVLEISDTITSLPAIPVPAADKLNVYPNPADEYVSFEYLGQPQEETEITIFNSMGSKIKNLVLYHSENKIIWDVRQIPSGVYFFNLSNDDFSVRGKIVIN